MMNGDKQERKKEKAAARRNSYLYFHFYKILPFKCLRRFGVALILKGDYFSLYVITLQQKCTFGLKGKELREEKTVLFLITATEHHICQCFQFR